MRRRCKSLAEGVWTYNHGTGESKNPMAMQVHHREWLALASLLYYIFNLYELFPSQPVRENRLPYRRLEQLASSLAS